MNLVLDGAVNLRDFGGYATADGMAVVRGRLFRSGTLTHLTQSARQQFAGLNVGCICDFRGPDEREREPTPDLGDVRRLEVPIDPGSAVALRAQMQRRSLTLGERLNFMVQLNRDLAREHAEDYARMFEALLAVGDRGFLLHCSAGKDRTGFGCALILHALGVPEETVLKDYLLTNEYMDYEGFVLPHMVKQYEAADLPGREEIMALAGVREEYLLAALGAIHEEFAGVEHYIERAIGLDQSALNLLRQRYLADADE